MVKKVLFVCVGNSGRSQMAEAFSKRSGEGVIEAESAGTEPAEGLSQTVVAAMREIGCDMSGHHPKMITLEMVNSADRVITMGCDVEGEVCPAALVSAEDWGLEDPHGKPIEKVREIRDEIKRRVAALVAEMKSG